MTPLAPARVTSPLLRLFAVFWWLLVAGSVAVAVCGLLISWADYHSSREYTAYQADLDALAKLPRVLPDTTSNQQTPFVFKPDNPVPPDPSWYVVGGAVVLLLSLLPFTVMTATRWIITSRWRFGPRW